jgi:hypothetical protein
VVHAYGVVRAGTTLELPIAGVLGAPVGRLSCGAFDVLISVLPGARFGAHCWEEHGQDPEWLGPIARQHHGVLQHVVESNDVLPLRLPGVYQDEDQVCIAVASMREGLDTAFEVIGGRVEWTVKVWRSDRPAELPGQARPASGADYLRQRASQAADRDRRRDRVAAAALDVHEELAEVATHAVVSPPHGRDVTGRAESMVLNAAYLVRRDERDVFFAQADRCADRWGPEGYVVEVTGPWPPYSFSALRLEEVRTP